MHRRFRLIGPILFPVGVHIILSTLYQPRYLVPLTFNGHTIWTQPSEADNQPKLWIATGFLLVGVLGIYTDIYRPQQSAAYY